MVENQSKSPAIECRNVTVRFGSVIALNNVSLALEKGGIHAVVGQNGAGKTTFARVLSGIIQPSEGNLHVNGRDVPVGKANNVRQAGVELVHQSFALPPSFTVAEAMEFGSKRDRGGPFTKLMLNTRWKPHLESLGIDISPGAVIRDLPVETQQAVEIARALVSNAKILILDEPTAVLAPSNVERLFERLKTLQANGVTVILILHKIREMLAIADTVSILRGGKLIGGPTPVGETTPESIAEAIIGTSQRVEAKDLAAFTGGTIDIDENSSSRKGTAGKLLLTMTGVSTVPDEEGVVLSSIDLKIAQGEIVGVAGVEGNGQKTLVRALAALASVHHGRIEFGGKDFTRQALIKRRAVGLRIIPFERNIEGLSLSSSLWENWSALSLLLRGGVSFINPASVQKDCDAALRKWNVRFASTGHPAGSLSGGNAQKVILSREIDDDARVVIAAQPTRGLDIGASAFVWSSLRAVRDRGCGVLLISSDLDELFDICDRIIVMASGRIAAEFKPPYRLSDIGAAMTGVARQ